MIYIQGKQLEETLWIIYYNVKFINLFGFDLTDSEGNKTTSMASDSIVIDMGCMYNGYCSDMTRTIFIDRIDEDKLILFSDKVR